MKPLPHVYTARLTGGAEGYAEVAAAGVGELRTAPPADFDGPGDAWSPEQFLMAAVETCFLFTFRAVAKLPNLNSPHWRFQGKARLTAKTVRHVLLRLFCIHA
jgi:organic hydroperoxide reductase OsmC/OhrA